LSKMGRPTRKAPAQNKAVFSAVPTILCAAAGLLPSANAQFQFEFPQEFFQGGGGFHQQQQPQRRSRGGGRGVQQRVPRGIDEKFAWMKGTEWMWNNWREVRFEPDGTFDAPTDSCAQRQCKWSADSKQVYIMWGQDGVHWVSPTKPEATEGNILNGKREDGERCSAKYIRKVVADEDLDFYEVLGLDEDCTGKEIKKSYRDLAKIYHPDKCTGKVKMAGGFEEEEVDCATAMNRVNLAYEVLGDEDKRILYDAGGMDLVKQGVDEGGGQQGGMDPFAALFGGGGRQQRSNKGPDATVSHSVNLEDIYNGNEISMNINRRIVCRGCAGEKGAGKPKCASCGRCPDEVRMVQRQMGPGMIVQQEERVASKQKCKVEDTTLSAVIEKGVADGAEIKFPRKSEQSPGQVPGDVIMKLKTKRHKVFTRDGKDLKMAMKISLKEALLGLEKTVEHLDGHEVQNLVKLFITP